MANSQNHNQRKHSKIGASQAERWINCSGSVALCETVPKPPGSEAAERGTSNHEAAEYCLKHNLDAVDVIGMTFNKKFVFDKEDAVAVQVYLDHVRETFAKYAPMGAELLVEQKFRLPHIHPDLYGTSDVVIRIPFYKIIVMDYKNGVGLVEVEDNPQLKIYGLGAAYGDDYGTIELHIIQPNGDHEDGPVRIFTMDYEDLIQWSHELKESARKTEDPNAPLNAGKWCQYCAASAVCPVKRNQAMVIAQTDFEDAPKLPSVERMTDEQLVKILEQKGAIEAWFKSVKDFALLKLANGEKIPGLKLVRGRGSRKWTNEETVKKEFGDEILETKVLSVAQAEKVLGKAAVKGLWTQYEGNITVAPETDKREAIADAKDDFDAITFEVQNDD